MEVGRLLKLHGYRGAFSAELFSDQHVFDRDTTIWIGLSAESAREYAVEQHERMHRRHKLKFKGIDSDQVAKGILGCALFLERAHLPSPQVNEYYVADLVDASVREAGSDRFLGKWVGCEPAVAPSTTDRWWVETPDGRSFAIPAVRRYVQKVDAEAKVIWITHLEELE